MNPSSILQISELAGAKLEQGDGKTSIERISTDSRTIKKEELFVALRGENFDGHKFIEDVAALSASMTSTYAMQYPSVEISKNSSNGNPPKLSIVSSIYVDSKLL